ncbi:MAG TPA: sigma-70 family RNA polymerase sigma factor [Terriglobia bacterium]|nr:sigma-70 family RNA polymerase sigma factor [Terriglobia bacterium]
MTSDVSQLVDHLFRHQYGHLVSTLTRIFGLDNLDLVEDVVQETLLKALRHWPYHGIPDNPAGWLYQSAKNQALDIIRRNALFRDKAAEIARELEGWERHGAVTSLKDDELAMILACCHPALPRNTRVALTLKTVGGFGVAEIARAFLTNDTAIAQRLVRAKRRLRNESIVLEVPVDSEMPERLESVLDVLYFMFNEGYSAHSGANLVRFDLCEEAIRLVQLLILHPAGDHPVVHALAALMFLQASRLSARQTPDGQLLLLGDQDRTLWDCRLIDWGLYHLSQAGKGKKLTAYHLEAGIAACHSLAPMYELTDWPQILGYYDQLIQINPSPVVTLNRAVALSMIEGPQAGIKQLHAIQQQVPMQEYFLFHATLADFYRRAGLSLEARDAYQRAVQFAGSDTERRFLVRKLENLQ